LTGYETDYVDRVFRDSFYSYYSSKLNDYKRNCIKVSLFNCKVDYSSFRNSEKVEKLKKQYLGFFIIRPTEPQIIGRSVISPAALKINNFLTCVANIPSTANSIKFDSVGFPHSSQDTETITCAETTIWAIMEYFGNKYPDYKHVLPSKIITTLRNVSNERQLPSHGLQVHQMSYALKEFGFGTKIYSREEYGIEFERLLSCYIESGIPLIVALDNDKYRKSPGADTLVKYVGHALLCTGHVHIENYMIDSLLKIHSSYSNINNLANNKNIQLFDLDDIQKQFVFIDDNCPIYQKCLLNTPATHYNDISWNICEISYFIVPLYQKVYLEAFHAKNFVLGFLIDSPFSLDNNLNITIRTFLTSSRSYKQYVATNELLNEEAKDEILEQKMPKFIWVTELSTKELLKTDKVNGLVILDATEPNQFNFKTLLLAFHSNFLVKYTKKERSLEKSPLPLQPFSKFDSNLKHITI